MVLVVGGAEIRLPMKNRAFAAPALAAGQPLRKGRAARVATRAAACACLLLCFHLHAALVSAAAAQNPTPREGQMRRQKIANPLNGLLDEAQRDIDKSDFAAAIDPLQKVIAEEPNVAYPHFQLAYVFTALQRVEEARAEYERVIALDPKMAEAYLNLGILLLEKDPAAAVSPLKKAVELLPGQSRPRFLLGVAQERSHDLAAAVNSLESVSNLDPKNTETVAHLGNLYLLLQRPADAEIKFRQVLDAAPNDASALL